MEEIGIESSTLHDILARRKTIEGVLGGNKFLGLRVGDTLRFREDIWQDGRIIDSIPDRATVVITQLLFFETFAEMLSSVDFKAVVPNAQSVDEAVQTYYKYYSPADEETYGVIAIVFRLTA